MEDEDWIGKTEDPSEPYDPQNPPNDDCFGNFYDVEDKTCSECEDRESCRSSRNKRMNRKACYGFNFQITSQICDRCKLKDACQFETTTARRYEQDIAHEREVRINRKLMCPNAINCGDHECEHHLFHPWMPECDEIIRDSRSGKIECPGCTVVENPERFESSKEEFRKYT